MNTAGPSGSLPPNRPPPVAFPKVTNSPLGSSSGMSPFQVPSWPSSGSNSLPVSSTSQGVGQSQSAYATGRTLPKLLVPANGVVSVSVIGDDEQSQVSKAEAVKQLKYMFEELGRDPNSCVTGQELDMSWLAKCSDRYTEVFNQVNRSYALTHTEEETNVYMNAWIDEITAEAVKQVGREAVRDNIMSFVNREIPMNKEELNVVQFVIGAFYNHVREGSNWDVGAMSDADMQKLEHDLIKLSTYCACYDNPIPEGSTRKVLGSGAYNTTELVKNPDGSKVVVKPIVPEGQPAGCAVQVYYLGISRTEPRYEERNVATNRLADSLGFDVVADTGFGYMTDPTGKKGQRAIFMELAYGKSSVKTKEYPLYEVIANYPDAFEEAYNIGWDPSFLVWDAEGDLDDDGYNYKSWAESSLELCGQGKLYLRKDEQGVIKVVQNKYNRFPFENPEFRQKTVMLNYLDAITFQMDRHSNNFFVDIDDQGGCSLIGIDNDTCFPSKPLRLEVLTIDNYDDVGWRGTRLPHIADAKIYDAIVGMSDDEFKDQFADLLTNNEVDSALERLHFIQNHLKQLEADGKVIGKPPCSFNWGSNRAKVLLMERDVLDPHTFTSYFGREVNDYNYNVIHGETVLNLDGTPAVGQYV